MLIIPALLTPDKQTFEASLAKISGLSDWLQIDIIDGQFVPTPTVDLKELVDLVLPPHLEIHLMVDRPTDYFADCEKLHPQRVIIHCECKQAPSEIFEMALKHNFRLGVAINPDTPIERAAPYLQHWPFALIMSVVPGKQGNEFRSDVLSKIDELKKLYPHLTIGIDGSVNQDTIAAIAKTRVDYCIVGSALVKAENPKAVFDTLHKI